MWESVFAEMGLPGSALAKFAFEDGSPKVYTEKDPLAEDEAPLAPSGKMYKKINWMKAGILTADKVRCRTCLGVRVAAMMRSQLFNVGNIPCRS